MGRPGSDFIRALAEPTELAALFARYPVLARLLGEATRHAVDATAELLGRYTEDRDEIVRRLLGGTDPGSLVAIAPGRGDSHQRGRSVTMLRFAAGPLVVYRPREVITHLRLAGPVQLLNEVTPELGLRTPGVLARPGYGWLEHIHQLPMTEPVQAERFYRRLGAWLALLYVLHASDMHCENLIASGEWPVPVDVETLFQPSLPRTATPDPAAEALAGSVYRTALLPFLIVGEHGSADLSGLGGDGGRVSIDSIDWDLPGTDRMRLARRPKPYAGARNRAELAGVQLDPLDYEAALLHGFRLGYDAIAKHRIEFTELVTACTDLEVRVVARPTQTYASLLDESTHPRLLRDAVDRDRAFAVLDSEQDTLPAKLFDHELGHLWAGDVPLFTARAGGRELWSADRKRVAGVLVSSGLASSLSTLQRMSERDRRNQEWIIMAALASRRGSATHHAPAGQSGPVSGAAACPGQLMTAACAIADRIVAGSMVGGDRLNWLGLELVDEREWLVLPMGAGLGHGYLGVAVFLVQLAEVSGINRYAEVAVTALTALPRLLETLTGRPDLVRAIGPGGLHGLGGIGYGLARLARLLADAELAAHARAVVDLIDLSDAGPGWADGTAGCLAAMAAVHAELDLAPAAELAAHAAERTAEFVRNSAASGLGSGFAHGWAGIATALAASPAHQEAARKARDRVDPAATVGFGWCRGLAGAVIALADKEIPGEVRRLTDRTTLRDLSLCHGELGVIEALAAPVRGRRAAMILDAIDRYGPSCGTPGWVSTPGLANGLAGIGYGLLRLGFPDRVPAVLLLRHRPG
jgi:type 2 lantibiotic biosynthesis protein LanM